LAGEPHQLDALSRGLAPLFGMPDCRVDVLMDFVGVTNTARSAGWGNLWTNTQMP